MLPQCVVRVLHWQLGPLRGLAGALCSVCGTQVAPQRAQGPSVAGDVVYDEYQCVLFCAHAEQLGPQWYVCCEVEGVACRCCECRFEVGFADGGECQLWPGLVWWQDVLLRGAVGLGEGGAQALVPGDYVSQCQLQCGDV